MSCSFFEMFGNDKNILILQIFQKKGGIHMNIIHTGDWHLGKTIEGHSRLPEQELFLNDLVSICEERQPDMIIIAGDIYDTFNPPAAAEQLFYSTVKKMSRNGDCMIVVIAGNHDNPERLTAATSVLARHSVVIAGQPDNVLPIGKYGNNFIFQSGSGYIQGKIHGEKFDMILLPFPSERRMGHSILSISADETTRAKEFEVYIKDWFAKRTKCFRKDSVHLIASHIFVMGSVEEGSERSVQLGGSYLVSAKVFPNNADYIALGHVHKPQVVPGLHKARYSGSPIQYNQREANITKQVLFVSVSAGKDTSVESVSLPAYKPVETWKCDSVEAAIAKCAENAEKECWVYLEVNTDDFIREDDIKTMKSLKNDILSIMPIYPSVENDNQVIEPNKDIPLEMMVENYYKKKIGAEMSEETKSVLMDILGEDKEDK